jgi:hypothetical protein
MSLDPYASLQEISARMRNLQRRDDIESALDELEYVFEVIPPELQDNAEQLIGMLREKLTRVS